MSTKKAARPLWLLFLINLISAMCINVSRGTFLDAEVYIMLGAVFFSTLIAYLLASTIELGDSYLLLASSLLATIGITVLLRLKSNYGITQALWFVAGVVCFLVVAFIYKSVKKWYGVSVLATSVSALLYTLTLLFGTTHKGAKNWISIGGVRSIQPSEFIKILFVLAFSAIFSGVENKGILFDTNKKRLITADAVFVMNMGFLVLQREWGTLMLFIMVFIGYAVVFSNSKMYVLINISSAVLCGTAGSFILPHIRKRIDVWLNPYADMAGSGYQITQSLFAIGEGGVMGKGIGLGSPYFIPEVHSDFIFSAICEEMGLLGGVAVIMIYFLIVYRGFKIALSATNPFNKAVAFGISSILGFQTFIIIGGVIKLIPLTGITLPFISYGGSSMISTFALLGILQGISGKAGEMTNEL